MQHHAYIYEGAQAILPELADDARTRFDFSKDEHTPDVHVRVFEKFGIEESRWLIEAAALKSAVGRSLFVIGISSITTEAQQALLKLLEEPQWGTMFVLLVPHGSLLPTVKSRTLQYPEKLQPLGAKASEPASFLHSTGKARSDMIAQLLKDDEGAKERVRDFVNGLEAELSKKMGDRKAREGLGDIAKVRDYLRDRSPSLKMLLEHLALSLPTV